MSKKKHLKILAAIFSHPIKSNIAWKDIEAMLKYFNAEIIEAEGSRVSIILNDVFAVFHRAHPRKEADKGAVVSMRKFLENAGVTPNGI